ncbi:hypothetical protein DFH06DRAFT_1212609, partial [Mycena polygramma]
MLLRVGRLVRVVVCAPCFWVSLLGSYLESSHLPAELRLRFVVPLTVTHRNPTRMRHLVCRALTLAFRAFPFPFR